MSRVALALAAAGGVGSIGLMLRAGHRNDSLILLVLFAIWVVSPFVALAMANMVSKRWSVLTRATLYGVMLILTVGSLGIYGNMVSGTPGSKLAFPFLVVPLGSWLLMMMVIPMAALLSGRLSRFWPVRWLIKAVAAVVMLGVLGSRSCWDCCCWTTTGKRHCPRLLARSRSAARRTFGATIRRTQWRRSRAPSGSFLPGSGIPRRRGNRPRLSTITSRLHGGQPLRNGVACCSPVPDARFVAGPCT